MNRRSKRIKELEIELEALKNIKDIWYTKDYIVASNRVKAMSAFDMLSWADVVVSGMGLAFEDYRKHGTEESLAEIERTISALQALTEELIARHNKT